MIPVQFIEIDALPLTNNGKIDYQALPDVVVSDGLHKRNIPGNEIEAALLAVWQDVLGVKNAGLHDNFYECGGDSIKAFQIASRMSARGITIHARDILTYHSIEQIAAHAVTTVPKTIYNQGPVHGEKGFIPVEEWFFANKFDDPGFYTQSLVLRLKKRIQVNLLGDAFSLLVKHHDGLRLNYNVEKHTLFYNDKYLHQPYSIPVFEAGKGQNAGEQLIEHCQKIKKNFDLLNGLLIKSAVFTGYHEYDLLFITAHHLVIDGVSWRVLLEDLYAIYNALEKELPVHLPEKTASLIDWNELLVNRSRSMEWKARQLYWDEIEKTAFKIPLDFEMINWSYQHAITISGSLDKERTRFLLKDAHQVFLSDVPILLNTALAVTIKEWTGNDVILIEQEHHGRELDNADVSGTIGWFTTMYPVRLEIKACDIDQQVRAIKEQMRALPDHGMSYRRKYGSEKMAEIRTNYLGRFDNEFNNDLFEYSGMPSGPDIGSENRMTAKLELNSMIIGEVFSLHITYNTTAHAATTMSWLMTRFFDNLHAILDYIAGANEIHFTPSDFKLATLDQEELDALLG